MASETPGWHAREFPVYKGSGDQLGPALDGQGVIFKDMENSPAGVLMRMDLDTGEARMLPYPEGIVAGPAANAGRAAWQNQELEACLGNLAGESRCLALPLASAMTLSGEKAVTGHEGKIIRLVNFETMRHRMLDSSTTSGGRYDPDIEEDQAVWIRERGYAGQYYEPLVVSYDLLTDTLSYATKFGGGSTPGGESVYERRHPAVSNGRIMYQQRLRETGSRWGIYEAIPESFGVPVVDLPSDQINPSVSGGLLVYQDNRNGYFDASGQWVDNWDIYLLDLSTGEETPVSVAAGDQVNPVMEGNLVAWEDNRSGGWDIYAAELTGAAAGPPRLGLAVGEVFWGSFADYLARELSVMYEVDNRGEGPARDVAIRQAHVVPASVTVAGGMPAAVARLEPGESAALELRFNVPEDIYRFRTSIFASCRDAAGAESWFPAEPPA
ncbi:MAG: hypothetical protein IBX61_06545 [Thermoleophilia bacterium]|nr:hypothetical protein [Thermoleophilia bacterium]